MDGLRNPNFVGSVAFLRDFRYTKLNSANAVKTHLVYIFSHYIDQFYTYFMLIKIRKQLGLDFGRIENSFRQQVILVC